MSNQSDKVAQRIDYLIGALSKGNARAFARACEIDPSALSKIRNGIGNLRPETYLPRILLAYPSVSREWLYEGKGKPLKSVERTIEEYRQENERLWRLVEQYESIIDKWLSKEPKNRSTNRSTVSKK